MNVLVFVASIASLALVWGAAGLAFGLWKGRGLRAARSYAAALLAFSGFLWESLLRGYAAAAGAPGAGRAADFAVAVAAPLQLLAGGRFFSEALGLPRPGAWRLAHRLAAAALAGLGLAYLLAPGTPALAFAVRTLFFAAVGAWAAALLAYGRGSPLLTLGRGAILAASAGFALLVGLMVLDSFAGELLGPLDGASLPVFGLALSGVAVAFPLGRLQAEPVLLGGRLTEAFVAQTGLSPREAEVAALAAEGLSSARIGERLFISPRTVENHLAAVYEKTGAKGRVRLAQLLLSRRGNE